MNTFKNTLESMERAYQEGLEGLLVMSADLVANIPDDEDVYDAVLCAFDNGCDEYFDSDSE